MPTSNVGHAAGSIVRTAHIEQYAENNTQSKQQVNKSSQNSYEVIADNINYQDEPEGFNETKNANLARDNNSENLRDFSEGIRQNGINERLDRVRSSARKNGNNIIALKSENKLGDTEQNKIDNNIERKKNVFAHQNESYTPANSIESQRYLNEKVEEVKKDIAESIGFFGSNGAKHLDLVNLMIDVQRLVEKIQMDTKNRQRVLADISFNLKIDEDKAQALGLKNSAITKSSIQMITTAGAYVKQVKDTYNYSKTNTVLSNEKQRNFAKINENKLLASSTTFAANGSGAANKAYLSSITRDYQAKNALLDKKLGDLNAQFESQKALTQTSQMTLNSANELAAAQTRYDADLHGIQSKIAQKNRDDNLALVDSITEAMKQIQSSIMTLNEQMLKMINHYSGYVPS